MGIYTPEGITLLELWADASDTSPTNIVEDANKVSEWKDKSTKLNHLVQAVSGNQPYTNTRSEVTKNVIDFSAPRYLSVSFTAIPQPFTVALVAKVDGTPTYYVFDSTSGGIAMLRTKSGTSWRLDAGTTQTVSGFNTSRHVFTCQFNGSSSDLIIDGSSNAGNAGSNSLTGITLGKANGSAVYFDGYVAEIAIYSKSLSAGEKADLLAYFRQNWAFEVPLAPVDLVCTPGDEQNTITFTPSVGATRYDLWHNTVSPAENGTKIIGVDSGYVHTGLTNGQNYFYKVYAANSAGDSALSLEVSGEPSAAGGPAAPTVVSCASGTGKNTISFTKEPTATMTHLYWSLSSPVTKSDNKVSNIDADSDFVQSGLTNNIERFYALTSEDGVGEGDLSSEVSGKPIAIALSVAVDNGDGQISISWDAVAGATSYDIYYKNTSGVGKGDTRIASVTSPYVHTPLTNATPYHYVIVALNATGESDVSAEKTTVPLATPGSVVATQGNGQNTITWAPVAGADSYTIHYDTVTGVDKNDSDIALVTSPYVHGGLTNGTEIFYKVVALKGTDSANLSLEVSAKPIAPPASLVAIPGDASGKNDITWLASVGAVSYKLYWALTPGVTTSSNMIPLGDVLLYEHTGLDDDVEVFYRVLAVNSTGESGLSDEDSSIPYGIPVAPTGVYIVPGDEKNTLYFDPVNHADSYNAYWDTVSPVNTGDTPINGISSGHLHSLLVNGTEYFYVFTAVNTRGESVISSEVSGVPAVPVVSDFKSSNTRKRKTRIIIARRNL